MSRVFIVQNQHRWDKDKEKFVPKFDFTPAEEHGELVNLLSPTAAPFRTEEIVEELHQKLRTFNDDDTLLLVGNPVLIGMCLAVAADYNAGNIKVLQWSGKDKRYIPIQIDNLFTSKLFQ